MRKHYTAVCSSTALNKTIGSMTAAELFRALCAELKSHGIDTTMHKYELRAQEYERYSDGSQYTVKFKCPGDYLAYLAMVLHKRVRTQSSFADALVDYFLYEDDTDFSSLFDECGYTVNDMADHAESCWWGDGGDYITLLKNLDTGEVLYSAEPDYDEFDDREDDEW